MGWQQVVGWTALALGFADLAVLNLDVYPALVEQRARGGDRALGDSETEQPEVLPASPAAPSFRARTGDEAIGADALRAAAGERAGILDPKVALGARPSTADSDQRPVLDPRPQTVLGRLAFSFRAHRVHAGHRRQLKALASTLIAEADGRVLMVVGHTDSIGTEQNNHALGLLRAQAVADVLVELGLARTQLRVLSAGESFPRLRGRSLRDRRKNRRVELYWQGSPR